MNIDPRLIQYHRASDTGDMGDATDKHSVCRWRIDGAIYFPVFVRAKFTAGTGSATLSIIKSSDDDVNDLYDFTLQTVPTVGTSGTANVIVNYLPDEVATYVFFPGDDLVLEWTNPDSGTMRWAVEVGLYDAANLR